MISISAIFTMIMKVIFNLVGVAILVGITVAVGKVAFDIVKDIFIYAWRTVHKSSYESFLKKQKEKKENEKSEVKDKKEK